jgi:CBS domain-containing protein
MLVKDVMTKNPACCTSQTSLEEVAQMMVENDCGCIPIVENRESMKLVGTVTDRDICCRTVAVGRNPLEMTAAEIMTSPVVTVTPEDDVDDCCKLMETNQVRRVPVVDERGGCCGIVSQANIALDVSDRATAEVVQEVSRPTVKASEFGYGA